MKRIVCILIGLYGAASSAQVNFSTRALDFGILTASSERYMDIEITNEGEKNVFIFRMDVPREISVRFSSTTLKKDSSQRIRIKYNPSELGYFEYKLPLHLSNAEKPVEIQMKGYVESLSQNSSLECPDFGAIDELAIGSFKLNVTVIDSLTRAPIAHSNVVLLRNGSTAFEFNCDQKGKVVQPVPLGLYYFIVGADHYNGKEFPNYLNRNNNVVVVELTKKKKDTMEFDDNEVVVIDEQTEIDAAVSKVHEGPESQIAQDTGSFSLSRYAPNNIVFLVDISSSMKYTGKLDLLKVAMIELATLLRPMDTITIVAYASEAKLIMETISAGNKQQVVDKIKGLEAKGFTAGGKGMKLAYTKASGSFVTGGNNQIVMATDGAFTKGEDNIYKLAKKYRKSNVIISVLGIKNTPAAAQSMKKLAANGGGSYLHVKTYEQAKSILVDEIKSRSLIRP